MTSLPVTPQPASRTSSLSPRSLHLICIIVLVLGSVLWLYYLWFRSDAPWLHPELLGTAVYIWDHHGHEPISGMLRKVFDWAAFDPNVNRVRPLNDLTEVLDAIARPYLARIFGPHPSAMPSAFLTLILAPLFLFGWLRRSMATLLPAIILVLLFVSSTGFLSDIIAYIRPAKKLNLIFLCMALYYAQRFSERRGLRAFLLVYGSILASCFSDELGLANFVVIAILYWRSLFLAPGRLYRLLFLSLPVVFIVITAVGLPAVYRRWSIHGPWNAMGDPKKFAVFSYLFQSEFWLASLEGLGRSLLSTVAIPLHTAATETMALVVFLSLPMGRLISNRANPAFRPAQDRLVLATLALALGSVYATLLDWYPFPHQISYLGSFNYYYHSSIVVLVIVWLAESGNCLASTVRSFWARHPFGLTLTVTLLSGILLSANFTVFARVNRAVQIIHLYPYANSALWHSLSDPRLRHGTPDQQISVHVVGDSDREARRYKEALQALFGARWRDTYFYDVMGLIAPTPIMTPAHVGHLYTATYPWLAVSLSIEQQGVRGWTSPSPH